MKFTPKYFLLNLGYSVYTYIYKCVRFHKMRGELKGYKIQQDQLRISTVLRLFFDLFVTNSA